MLTIRQAAARLGVSPSVIYRLCREQVVPTRSIHIGSRRRVVIDNSQVEQYCRLCLMDAAELTPDCFFRPPTSDQPTD
jgi:excisionase family DNA binding protein